MRVVAAGLGTAVLLASVLSPAWGASACPQPAAASSAPVASCSKPAKVVAKAAVTQTVLSTTAPAPADTGWKSTLDPLAAGGWVMISDGPVDNPSVVYASSHDILHNGNVVTAWIRWEYSRSQAEVYPLYYQSAVTHEELDCDSRAYRRAAVFYYRRNNLQDKALQLTALTDDTNWKLAIPGTEGDAMLKWACAPPAAAHHELAEIKVLAHKSTDHKPGANKSGANAAATASAPAAQGLDLHTQR